MECEQAEQSINELIDRELNASKAVELCRHLKICRECNDTLLRYARLQIELKSTEYAAGKE